MAKYTKEQVVDLVLDFKAKHHQFPLPRDYEKFDDVKAMAKALGLNLKEIHDELGVNASAAINIEVLRELRRRNGQEPYIAKLDPVRRIYRY